MNEKILMISTLLGLGCVLALAQGIPPGENVIGKVTAVNGTTLTVAPLSGGDPVAVKIGDNARVFKDRQPAGPPTSRWTTWWLPEVR